jgi:peptidoglycan hydrolase-like protein with peptidoglycan-binding domain
LTVAPVAPPSSGGGGGGGGGNVVNTNPTPSGSLPIVTTTPKGSVKPNSVQYVPTIAFSNSIKKFSKNNDVLKLQAVLIKEGALASQYQTGYFGQLTEDALKKVQCQNKFTVCNGVVDAPTINLLNTLYNKHFPAVQILQPKTIINTGSSFQRTLKVGSTGQDVKNLQIFLNNNGYNVSTTGPGSIGNETIYFGPATARALSKFQEAYANDILTPSGLTKGTGYFGPASIQKANSLQGIR